MIDCYNTYMDEAKLQKLIRKEEKKARKAKGDKYVKRLAQKSLYRDIGRVMDEKGIGSPAEFLATVMAGEDPRVDDSSLLDIIEEVQERGLDALPTLDEWILITELIRNNEYYAGRMVPIEYSNKAAEILAKHLYAQKTENKTQVDAKVEIAPLTKKEIKKFQKVFEKEF